MELKWLADFLSLANSQSFSRSAQERNVTQPAFSRRIKALEAWLGTELIDRSQYPTSLTPHGRAFRETAEEVVRLLHQDRDEFRNDRRKAQASLSFASLHTLSLGFYAEWLKEIEAVIGPLKTRLSANDLHDCLQALTEGGCDFLLCYAHPSVPLLLDATLYPSFKLGDDRLMPVSSAAANGAARHQLPGTLDQPVPYLSYSDDSFLGRLEETIIHESPAPLHIDRTYENSMGDALKAMVLAGYGIAWLPESLMERELADGLLMPAGDESLMASLEIRIYRSLEKTRPMVEEIWRFLQDQSAPAL